MPAAFYHILVEKPHSDNDSAKVSRVFESSQYQDNSSVAVFIRSDRHINFKRICQIEFVSNARLLKQFFHCELPS